MTDGSLIDQHRARGATWMSWGGGVSIPAHFGDHVAEYHAIATANGLHDRSYRALLEVRGADRAGWLHNLTTNEIRNLGPGEGNYAFALNAKGRILFDLNVFITEDAILVDVDRRWLSPALEHLGKYIIMEDVQLTDVTATTGRMAVLGPTMVRLAEQWGAANVGAMADLQHAPVIIDDVPCRMVRHDFAGSLSLELIMPAEKAPQMWDALLEGSAALCPVGIRAVQVHRVEAGRPWSLEDIDETVLPAETRQIERAVSFQKGCYLGQEVVERMRAHRSVARLLVGLRFENGEVVPGAILHHDGQPVGRVTSVIDSIRLQSTIGLGYLKSALAAGGTQLQAVMGERTISGTVQQLPFES